MSSLHIDPSLTFFSMSLLSCFWWTDRFFFILKLAAVIIHFSGLAGVGFDFSWVLVFAYDYYRMC